MMTARSLAHRAYVAAYVASPVWNALRNKSIPKPKPFSPYTDLMIKRSNGRNTTYEKNL